MSKKYNLLILSVLLIGALVATVFLTRQNQEVRRGASSSNTNLSLLPTESEKNVGDDFPVHLNFDGGIKVDNIKTRICYNSSLLQIKGSGASINGPVCGWCGLDCKMINFDSECSGTPGSSVAGKVCVKSGSTCVSKKSLYPNSVFGPFGGELIGTLKASQKVDVNLFADQLVVSDTGSINQKYKMEDIDTAPESLRANGVDRCVDITVGSTRKAANLKDTDEAAVVHFQAKKVGEGKIVFVEAETQISGEIAGLDKAITVGDLTGLSYKITKKGTPPTGNEPVLNFKMAFGFVRPNSACADWKAQVMVMNKDGVSKTYEDVALVKTGEINAKGETVYQASLKLEGFTNKNNLAVFIKGPKHLRMKYGVNNQTAYYNKAGGEIDGLTNDAATSPMFNFSGYSVLPGDVTGGPGDTQDGVINALDFAFIKAQTVQRLAVTAGQDIKSDLNGDCSTNSTDTVIFTQSLIDKQEQLY